MDAAHARNRSLHRLRPAEAIAAIDAAWPHAAPSERRDFAFCLLQIAAPAKSTTGPFSSARAHARRDTTARLALARLAGLWADLDPDLRALAIAAGRERWAEAIRTAAAPRTNTGDRSLALLAADSADPALVPLLIEILDRGESRAVQAVARALLAHALRIAADDPATATFGSDREWAPLDPDPPPWTNADLRRLLEAVAHAVEGFEVHGRKEALLAALVLLRGPRVPQCPGDPLAAMARDPDSPAAATIRTAIRRGRSPLARHRAWLWLREEATALACTDRLAQAPTPEDHRVVLELGHLALAPARARHLEMIRIPLVPAPARTVHAGAAGAKRLHPTGPVPGRAVLSGLPASARRHLPRLVASLGTATAPRDLALDPLLADPDPVVRLAAARAVSAEPARDFCFDQCEPVARHAALRWSGVGTPESARLRAGDPARAAFASRLARSPHQSVRAIGREEISRLTPGHRTLPERLAARRLADRSPDALSDWVRDRIEEGPRPAVEALMTVRRIGAPAAVEPLLLGLIGKSMRNADQVDARVVATAVACLGGLDAARVGGLLRRCLEDHPDARVRSNAAEALAKSSDLASAGLEDPHHRVRGSVVRAAIAREPRGPLGRRAVEALGGMLADRGPSERLAGVWVVHRSLSAALAGALGDRWDGIAARVRWLADEDSDEGVRRRASVVTGRLDGVRFRGVPGPVAREGVGR